MSKPEELSISELRRRRQGSDATGPASNRPTSAAPRIVEVGESPPVHQRGSGISEGSFKRFTAAVRRSWRQVALVTAACGVGGLAIGYLNGRYSASLTLVQRDTEGVLERGTGEDSFRPRQLSAATMVQLMASPELARRVALAIPSARDADLRGTIRVDPAPDRELVTLSKHGSRPQELIDELNVYAKQAVALTREIQIEDCTQLTLFLRGKLRETEAELSKVNAELQAFRVSERTTDPEAQSKALVAQLGEVMTRLESARMEAELLELQSADTRRSEKTRQNVILERMTQTREKIREKLLRLTDAHPEVIALNAELAELERQLSGSSTNAAPGGIVSLANMQLSESQARKSFLAGEVKRQEDLRDSLQRRLSGLSQQGSQYQLIMARQDSLLRSQQFLTERQRAAQLYLDNAAGYYRVLSEATLADVSSRGRYWAGITGLLVGLLVGLAGSVAGICMAEARDDRIKTAEDLERVTGLPVLATVGDLGTMSEVEKDRWAFRTWTLINGKLNRTPDRGLVCGFVSAQDGEGKTTWIDLLATAARLRGLQVLKVTARTSAPPLKKDEHKETPHQSNKRAPSDLKSSTLNSPPSSPASLALKLADTKAGSVDVCLPDWVWSVDHRRQWQAALDRWKSVENVVILVELPAAGLPESMLLAENVPQLIWLAASGTARARETQHHLEALKHARCQIVGAVLNKAPGSLLNL